DAVQELKILENNYAAEYGRNGGGVVSVVTKSGSNTLHGTAYDYIRNDAFNANTYFNNKAGTPRDVLKRHQFGVTVGGPVVIPHLMNGHDKLFFFSAYQGQRQTQTITTQQFGTYTPLELGGHFSKSNPLHPTPTKPAASCEAKRVIGGPDCGVTAFLNAHPAYQANAALRAQAIIDPTKIDAVTQKYIAAGLIPTSATGLS